MATHNPAPPPDEEKEGLPEIAPAKTQNRLRRHQTQVNELNATRDSLHKGGWDG
jgi:tRNA (adenine-N(1)-)-methyltransferase non-catalytic subunit